MKIVVVGLRGFPNIQGGIETHCEELFPRIARLGHQITVVRRSGFVKEDDGFLQHTDAVLNILAQRVQVGGELGAGGEDALAVLALGLAEQLL